MEWRYNKDNIVKLFKTTESHKKYWANRKNWVQGYTSAEAINHPHRKVLTYILKQFKWFSLMEIGCGPGPNLVAIVKAIPGRQVGGVDVSADAIEAAGKMVKGAMLKVNSADDMMMSDKSTDVIMSDMTLIYVGSRKIDDYIKEIKRVARNHVLLCEFHSNSFWNRLALKINTGYNAHNWDKLLKKHGFYDIMRYKLKESDWPGGEPQKTFGYVFLAKVPKR